MKTDLSFTTDPAWPWSLSGIGTPGLLAVALLLVALTVWTYAGVAPGSRRRIAAMIALRLAALLLAILAVIRPSLASRDSAKMPSTLLLLLDDSESMTIQDEFNRQSRWDALQQILRKCDPLLQQLRDEQNVTVRLYRFAADVRDYDPDGPADGKRTDFGNALHELHQRHAGDRNLRALLLCSDGADNGTRFLATTEAEKWRSIACPISTFSLGQPTTSSQRQDILVLGITPEPSPVPVKGKLTVKGIVDAPGFVNTLARVRLFIDGKEVASHEERLTKVVGNEVKITTTAPEKPGEIKVTLRVEGQPGEITSANNEMTTYVTVAKEGLSVLYVEGKFRAWEPQFIRRALRDPRIRLDYLVRLNDNPLSPAEAEVLQFRNQHYDVILLGDITAKRLSGGDPAVLDRIDKEVKKGTGLMMLGGYESFGNSDWQGTPIAGLLPVHLDANGQVQKLIRMVPTAQGLDRYVMRLTDKLADNRDAWEKLPRLEEVARIGKPKPGAVVLARANDPQDGEPLLVAGTYGEGRTLAFAVDTTWKWHALGLPAKEPAKAEGMVMLTRFWKQVAIWLAKQEESPGSVWVKPDTRRLSSGGKLGFRVGARGKGDEPLTDARFEATVADPQGNESPVQVTKEADGNRGVFWKTDLAGEYQLRVRAYVKGADGKERKMDDEAKVRFLVYQDTTELARQAADHVFLEKLAKAGGGKSYRMEELPRLLQELKKQPLARGQRPKVELYPDWRRGQTTAFLPGYFLAFVTLLGVEWFLRRSWGLV